jgi:ABC-type branched-subunit amino acid transport system substrate-binding protein
MARRVFLALLAACAGLSAQTSASSCTAPQTVARPASRTAEPYAGTPEDLRPYSKFTVPYDQHYTATPEYNGPADEARTIPAAEVSEVALGFLGPVTGSKDAAMGVAMLHGAQLAVDEANARGGYCGKVFRLKIHNDAAIWGASSNELVKMVYDEKVWAMLGSIAGDSTHIALRVSLRAELPIVNSASTDPTLPETIIPWLLTTIQDDRVQSYTLARRIYTDLGLKRVGLLRVSERYGRLGVVKFRDASRRLGHPVVIEQKFDPAAQSFTSQLRVINDSGVDAVVLWGDAGAAGIILREMRQMGMKQPVFGSSRVVGAQLLDQAGAAAEGLEVVYPFDPSRGDPAWLDFQRRYEAAYRAKTDAFSALAFDTMNILLDAIGRAGLNRGGIRNALYGLEKYKGVTGEMTFDPNAKNTAPMFLGKVHNGQITYRRYGMEKPYATVGSAGVEYNGPVDAGSAGAHRKIGLFGPGADTLAGSLSAAGYEVVGISSEGLWGKASSELVKLVYDPDVIGVVTTDRAASHLAEQLAVKVMFPVVAISADPTLTSTNVPWIFRLEESTPAADAVQCLRDAAERAGASRGSIRAYLASGKTVAGLFSFGSTGELNRVVGEIGE